MKQTIEMSKEAKKQKAIDIKLGKLKRKWLEDEEVNSFVNALLEMITKKIN